MDGPPQTWDLSITEAVWDQPDRGQNKRQKHPKKQQVSPVLLENVGRCDKFRQKQDEKEERAWRLVPKRLAE